MGIILRARSWWIAHSTQRQPRGCNNGLFCFSALLTPKARAWWAKPWKGRPWGGPPSPSPIVCPLCAKLTSSWSWTTTETWKRPDLTSRWCRRKVARSDSWSKNRCSQCAEPFARFAVLEFNCATVPTKTSQQEWLLWWCRTEWNSELMQNAPPRIYANICTHSLFCAVYVHLLAAWKIE